MRGGSALSSFLDCVKKNKRMSTTTGEGKGGACARGRVRASLDIGIYDDTFDTTPTTPKYMGLGASKVVPLYIVLPYFNYCKFGRRKELFVNFLKHMADRPHIRVVVVEAMEVGDSCQLPKDALDGIFLYVSVETQHRIWIKESLINIGIRHMPSDWENVAWIDADLEFTNKDWVRETQTALKVYDVVQLFQTCVGLGPHGEAIKTDKSFGFMYLRSGKPYTKTYKYGFWHPGYAWACSRRAYETMGGLIDWGILGSGDHHMALALIQKVDSSHPGNIHAGYSQHLRDFEGRVKPLKLGYVPGTILHYWHGRMEDRRYRERWDILTNGKYDPNVDIYRTKNGLVQLSLTGLRLEGQISEYFVGRREDNMKL